MWFIETEDIRKVREGKADPISAAAPECFSHEGLALLSRFLVFAGTFELVIVSEDGLPYLLGCYAEIDF